MTIASFSGESWACHKAASEGVFGRESRNLERDLIELSRFFPSAVMLTKQPFLERSDLRISSSEDDILSQS